MSQDYDISLNVEELALSRGEDPLVAGLSFSLQSGQALWLTGANGIGKTSLLLALANLIPLDDGRIDWSLDTQTVTPPDALAFSAFRGPERDGLSLAEDLAIWQRIYADPQSLSERLDSVGLSGRDKTPVAGLSAGQRRRLAMARLFASRRAAWLMDEPLAGLDTDGRALVSDSLAAHLRKGGLAIIASHHPVAIPGIDARKLIMEPAT